MERICNFSNFISIILSIVVSLLTIFEYKNSKKSIVTKNKIELKIIEIVNHHTINTVQDENKNTYDNKYIIKMGLLLLAYSVYSVYVQSRIVSYFIVLVYFILNLFFLGENRKEYKQPVSIIILLIGLFAISFLLSITMKISFPQNCIIDLVVIFILFLWKMLFLISIVKAILKIIFRGYQKKSVFLLNYGSLYNNSIIFSGFILFINLFFLWIV